MRSRILRSLISQGVDFAVDESVACLDEVVAIGCQDNGAFAHEASAYASESVKHRRGINSTLRHLIETEHLTPADKCKLIDMMVAAAGVALFSTLSACLDARNTINDRRFARAVRRQGEPDVNPFSDIPASEQATTSPNSRKVDKVGVHTKAMNEFEELLRSVFGPDVIIHRVSPGK